MNSLRYEFAILVIKDFHVQLICIIPNCSLACSYSISTYLEPFVLFFIVELPWVSLWVICSLRLVTFPSLQIQRNLQLRIEEQGKYLQMMFEKQCKSGVDKLNASSSSLDDPSAQPSDAMEISPDKSELEPSKVDHGETEADPVKSNVTSAECAEEQPIEKQKSPETEACQDPEPDVCMSSSSPPKRPKIKE